MTESDAAFARRICPHMPLDPGIVRAVRVLMEGGVETFESCEGGNGHAFPEPTIRFHGQRDAGWHAFAVARRQGLAVKALRRVWDLEDDEPTGPCWEMVFRVNH